MFFMDTVEPIYKALKNSNMQLLFDTLGIKRFPIKKKSEKAKWKELQQQLENARTKRAIDVFELIKQSKLIPIPPKLDSSIPKGKEASFERNRNLFYVCCSRAKKRLFLFVTVPTDYEFKAFLMSLIGKDNIYTYSQFLEMER